MWVILFKVFKKIIVKATPCTLPVEKLGLGAIVARTSQARVASTRRPAIISATAGYTDPVVVCDSTIPLTLFKSATSVILG